MAEKGAKLSVENSDNCRVYNTTVVGENSELIVNNSNDAILSNIKLEDKPKSKNWQNNILLYFCISIIIAVIAFILGYYIVENWLK